MRIANILILIAGWMWAAGVAADRVPPGSDDQIRERLQPFGSVCRTGDECGATSAATGSAGTAVAEATGGASAGTDIGKSVYDTSCFACHATGVGGAPKFGDTAAWAPRRDAGMDAMMQTTLNGKGAMPPRGTCMACSDDDLAAAIQYMLDNAQ